MGHIENFGEAFLDTELKGEVIASALKGDLTCRYVVFLPDNVMELYVKQASAE